MSLKPRPALLAPLLTAAGADQTTTAMSSGGNMEGKEVRFGIANTALYPICQVRVMQSASHAQALAGVVQREPGLVERGAQ